MELLKSGQTAVMVAFLPPDIRYLPLKEAVNKVRTVPADSEFMRIAQSLGIYLGTPCKALKQHRQTGQLPKGL